MLSKSNNSCTLEKILSGALRILRSNCLMLGRALGMCSNAMCHSSNQPRRVQDAVVFIAQLRHNNNITRLYMFHEVIYSMGGHYLPDPISCFDAFLCLPVQAFMRNV